MTDNEIKKILVFVETTDEAIKASEYAIRMARQYQFHIVALNVINRVLIDQLERASGKSRSEIEIEVEENGWKYLYFLEETAKDEQVSIVIAQESGAAEDLIATYAERYAIDCIIFGYSKGDINVRRLANKIVMKTIERCDCSVLVVQ